MSDGNNDWIFQKYLQKNIYFSIILFYIWGAKNQKENKIFLHIYVIFLLVVEGISKLASRWYLCLVKVVVKCI